ncbi:MAG: hypothetical protein LKK36_06065 [Ewingella americana]|jgi:hypothetical protein|uniref:hypothetical protein n=1 Tax=Ewingella americana TaxID=41202 RepID=UPI002430AE6E|nr:hypothetical protein [Ewingella americana]MCI1676598.1 hypothetical protein [Ewingella americana]MCI1853812.1 hypothetical protein [Ewingella americana]MCI1859947.1 hypothetical protein [Ewingella americana]MCI2142275.1 hypothetical protein [Ewingella americana]MCI2163238.1 hypothetical protein [Ewingella americana]
MTDIKEGFAQDGYQPMNEGYQPKNKPFNNEKKEFATNGHQPEKQIVKPAPPPKKP